jgi:hypothetical protein
MALFERKTLAEKQAAKEAEERERAAASRARAEAEALAEAQRAAAAHALAAHVAGLPKWEYYFETLNLTSYWTTSGGNEGVFARMNELGAQGWEIVSYTSTPVFGSVSAQATGYATLALFKRRAPDEAVDEALAEDSTVKH